MDLVAISTIIVRTVHAPSATPTSVSLAAGLARRHQRRRHVGVPRRRRVRRLVRSPTGAMGAGHRATDRQRDLGPRLRRVLVPSPLGGDLVCPGVAGRSAPKLSRPSAPRMTSSPLILSRLLGRAGLLGRKHRGRVHDGVVEIGCAGPAWEQNQVCRSCRSPRKQPRPSCVPRC